MREIGDFILKETAIANVSYIRPNENRGGLECLIRFDGADRVIDGNFQSLDPIIEIMLMDEIEKWENTLDLMQELSARLMEATSFKYNLEGVTVVNDEDRFDLSLTINIEKALCVGKLA